MREFGFSPSILSLRDVDCGPTRSRRRPWSWSSASIAVRRWKVGCNSTRNREVRASVLYQAAARQDADANPSALFSRFQRQWLRQHSPSRPRTGVRVVGPGVDLPETRQVSALTRLRQRGLCGAFRNIRQYTRQRRQQPSHPKEAGRREGLLFYHSNLCRPTCSSQRLPTHRGFQAGQKKRRRP